MTSCEAECDVPLVDEACEITKKFKRVRQQIIENNESGKLYAQKTELYFLSCSENAKTIQELNGMPKSAEFEAQCAMYIERREQMLRQLAQQMEQQRIELFTSICGVIAALEDVQFDVYKRLNDWRCNQRLACYGDRGLDGNKPNLGEIQTWFGELYILISNTRTSIDSMRNSDLPHSQTQLNQEFEGVFDKITKMLQHLISSSFVVEEQPPQVIKKETRFAASVRLLLTNINIDLVKPRVTISILSESQAKLQQQSSTALTEASGDILNNTGCLDLRSTANLAAPQTGRQLACSLRNMQLKKIKRAEKKGNECVMDEKFALLFQTKFQIFDLQLDVWVMSLPVVVIVHGSQESPAWATVLWDNAFSLADRTPFEVGDEVSWSTMSWALRVKFLYQTSCCLSDENLHYLYEKAFGAPIIQDDRKITWSQFCKDLLPDRDFTFWEWFYAIMKLTRDHLSEAWNEDLIVGFISKDRAEKMLLQYQPGTFLLRFSDSILGGITAAWMELDDNKTPNVVSLQPFCHKDFENTKRTADDRDKRSNADKHSFFTIGDLIKDLHQCAFLYPGTNAKTLKSKHETFGKYYTHEVDTSKGGYVIPKRKIVVPSGDESKSELSGSCPSNAQLCCRQTSEDYRFESSAAASSNHFEQMNNTLPFLSSPMDADDDFNAILQQANLHMWQFNPSECSKHFPMN